MEEDQSMTPKSCCCHFMGYAVQAARYLLYVSPDNTVTPVTVHTYVSHLLQTDWLKTNSYLHLSVRRGNNVIITSDYIHDFKTYNIAKLLKTSHMLKFAINRNN